MQNFDAFLNPNRKVYQHFILKILAGFLLLFWSACSPENSHSQTEQRIGSLSHEAKEYFVEVAFGSEFGLKNHPKIIKWKKDIKIFLLGEQPAYLTKELQKIIRELNQLQPEIHLEICTRQAEANLLLVMGEAKDYLKIEHSAKSYIKDNWGLFTIYENDKFEIDRASVFVDTHRVLSKKAQKHLLREELTQSLGLMQDSPRHPDSIFYASWTETTEYSNLDKLLIRILYHPSLLPGTKPDDLEKIWRTL